MSNVKGLIFDVQGFSVHDGPGSRTTVFLSGCPLACGWCANPEGRKFKQQLMYSEKRCKSTKDCQRCVKA
ncbi:MAG TPA: 4Fe-4S cluster-binding domain-containing protein [Negativicutes bacterium]|nr:4Fe-4S cluster-binding domain-containing protein [Negativicutes bacterium]